MGIAESTRAIEGIVNDESLKKIQHYRQQNAEIMKKYGALVQKLEHQQISSFDELQRFDEQTAESLIQLASNTAPLDFDVPSYGFFGLTSTGKSTLINKLLGRDVAETGIRETTTKIQSYDGNGYRLYDVPGRNDDLSYFTMEYISFWKGLTARIVLITSTIKEMTKVFHLLDAFNLSYDIVVNKFDLAPFEEREIFQKQIEKQIKESNLQGVNHIWYVSAKNPQQFPDWIKMVHSLTEFSKTPRKSIHGYYIKSRMNGFVLDVYDNRKAPGTQIISFPMKTNPCEDPSNQLWIFDKDGTIRSISSGMVIDIKGGIHGTDLVIWPKNGGANQKWVKDNLYLVCPCAAKVIDIAEKNCGPCAKVVAWSKNGGVNQQWDIVPKYW